MTERCRLYIITPPKLDPKPFGETLKEALDAGDVACLQLRLKEVPDEEIVRAAEVLMPIAQARGVAFLVNDRPDLAAKLGADGVHIGQDDGSYSDARKIVGPDRIIGVTCHDSRHLAMEAGEAGADYVAFGAFYPTTTKEPKSSCDIEVLRWWSEMMLVPQVAIGGITVENARPLIEAGADFLAVSHGIWAYKDGVGSAVKCFNALF